MAHAINAHHDAPLQLGVALQKTLRVIGQCTGHWQRQKYIHRDKHRKQVEVLGTHQKILKRQHRKKRQHQAPVVSLASR